MPVLKTLIKGLDYTNICGPRGLNITGISANSKQVRPGYIFVAVDGANIDGRIFIGEAIKNGAVCVIAGRDFETDKPVTKIFVRDTRIAVAKLSNIFFNYPSQKLKVIGITGTNGKTTTAYFIESILKSCGYKCGVIGTINYRFGRKVVSAKNTTPGPIELGAIIQGMVESAVEYCIMEVSSHALHQRRVDSINFDSAIFTNLTHEHLDYHKDMFSYFKAKARLFSMLSNKNMAVLNMDDKYYSKFKKATKGKVISYAIDNKKADVTLQYYEFVDNMQRLVIKTPIGILDIKTNFIGRHNIYNILCAVAFAYSRNIDFKHIKTGIKILKAVPGRLQEINSQKDFRVFVDYAHTDDGLRQVLNSLSGLAHNRIILVFGCGGDRCKTKRPKMGYIASLLADYVIVTNDNPRSEDPRLIVKSVINGFRKGFADYTVLLDRKKAIKKAISLAGPKDVVLIAGKGHEDYQIFKKQTIHFDDAKIAQKFL